jgi:hypothetical protein
VSAFLDPRFKDRLSNDRHVFCAQKTSWLKEETEATSNPSNDDVEALNPPSPKKALLSFFDAMNYATSSNSSQKGIKFIPPK